MKAVKLIEDTKLGLYLYALIALTIFLAIKYRFWFAFASLGPLLLAAWNFELTNHLSRDISLIVDNLMDYIVAFALGGAAYSLLAKLIKGSEHAMYLLVGRVLGSDTHNTVFSETRLTQDVFGGVGASTSHDIVVTHNTWLYDLNNDIEVNYSGSGSLPARPGHILGTMAYRGRSLLDVNFTTNKSFSIPPASTSIVMSIVMAFAITLLGWVLFPIFMLAVTLSWLGLFDAKPFFTTAKVPGTDRIEAIFVYAFGVTYGLLFVAFFSLHIEHPLALLGMYVAAFILAHNLLVRKLVALHTDFIEHGHAELNRLFKEAEAKHTARASAAKAREVASAV
ncbi:hypothetical protein NA633_03360 [Pseudomonas stutzeri]|uniref:hypothetical protein n=1 Tax=Stutzerimonas stutzeri TaxID=316 RepID=UPI001184BCED|nr:hypothetical protein [Stutzerimonas stutzeri]MCQ4282138.1 hypothetical protein [Stutzerimonas stutzeri]